MSASNEIVQELLGKPLWQMSGEEYMQLTEYVLSKKKPATPPVPKEELKPEYIHGIQALAEYLGCSESTVYLMKKDGIFDKAIVSTVGKKIIFDGRLALKLANKHREKTKKVRVNSHDST